MARRAVIMAGGAGTRLWPLSRAVRPKQLLRLFDGKSLLRTAYERLAGMLPAEQIHVIAGQVHLEAIAAELPELPAANLIGEPCGRDTANAVGLAAALLHRIDPDGVMGIFTADHIIEPVERFQKIVTRGFETAVEHPDALVTFGIKPTHAHTGLGYVQRGESMGDGVHRVRQFKEKPDEATARKYVESGDYSWNSGMFVWRTATIRRELARHIPASYKALEQIAEQWDTPNGRQTAEKLYPTLERISIDFAIMEKASEVAVVEMDCKWLDVGSWPALESVLEADAAGNVSTAGNTMTLDAAGNIFVSESDHLIAVIGVEDLVIVHSDDATLICRKQDAQRLKELVAELRDKHGERYM